jgi:hypothetical protein
MRRVIHAARRLRRRFLPAHVRADVRDTELLVALMEEVLEPDSDCLDVGAHAGSVLAELVRLAPEGRHVAWEPLPEFVARPTPGRGSVETIVVETERLDDALPDGVRPAFVKIDVEGAEERVLRGALQTLRRHRPVIAFEHGHGSADHYGSGPHAIHRLLVGELGYEIFGLDGEGPYDGSRFAEIFARGERVNFAARRAPTGH